MAFQEEWGEIMKEPIEACIQWRDASSHPQGSENRSGLLKYQTDLAFTGDDDDDFHH